MRSDVAVGSCLSGGLDSTAIVAAMVGHMGGAELPTFTYIADDDVLSEEKYLNIALERYPVTNFQTKPGIFRVLGNKKGAFTRDRQPKAAAHTLRSRWTTLNNRKPSAK
jgi:hypothetical protein